MGSQEGEGSGSRTAAVVLTTEATSTKYHQDDSQQEQRWCGDEAA